MQSLLGAHIGAATMRTKSEWAHGGSASWWGGGRLARRGGPRRLPLGGASGRRATTVRAPLPVGYLPTCCGLRYKKYEILQKRSIDRVRVRSHLAQSGLVLRRCLQLPLGYLQGDSRCHAPLARACLLSDSARWLDPVLPRSIRTPVAWAHARAASTLPA